MAHVPPFSSDAVHRYVSERQYRDPDPNEVAGRASLNDSDFVGVPGLRPGAVYAWQFRDTASNVHLGAPLRFQGHQPSWPSWGVCRPTTRAMVTAGVLQPEAEEDGFRVAAGIPRPDPQRVGRTLEGGLSRVCWRPAGGQRDPDEVQEDDRDRGRHRDAHREVAKGAAGAAMTAPPAQLDMRRDAGAHRVGSWGDVRGSDARHGVSGGAPEVRSTGAAWYEHPPPTGPLPVTMTMERERHATSPAAHTGRVQPQVSHERRRRDIGQLETRDCLARQQQQGPPTSTTMERMAPAHQTMSQGQEFSGGGGLAPVQYGRTVGRNSDTVDWSGEVREPHFPLQRQYRAGGVKAPPLHTHLTTVKDSKDADRALSQRFGFPRF